MWNRHRASGVGLVDPSDLPVTDSAFLEKVRELVTHWQWLWIYYFIICDLTVKEIMELEGKVLVRMPCKVGDAGTGAATG